MLRPTRYLAVLLAAMLATGVTLPPDASAAEPPSLLNPAPHRWVGGRLSPELLAQLDALGVKEVISVAPDEETPEVDEAALLAAHGIRQHAIPVAGPEDLTRKKVEELDRVLRAAGDENVFLHCASGNRVGALVALRAAWIEGLPVEEALRKGRAWGLTRLEPIVRERLQSGAAAQE
ncbi:MAG: hypothetical protein KatS3mg126_2259 [Lysobacteraceae bacterium]|nr:MAG: hypothetical protein KatS3mg126_2259 [Xanthomonadaceae bacterium]